MLSLALSYPLSMASSIKVAPAPWKLKGRSWIFLVSALSSTSSFPAGWSSAYQADALSSGGEFIGGLGLIQIVSYAESPVGPYDELIYVPGRWKYSDGTKAFRITQIYVSTEESTLNGRKNWNIPKQIANFDIKTGSDGTTDISVTQPNASSPFFKASIKSIPILSSISVPSNTSILGSYYKLMQPPLPAGENPEDVATHQWASLIPTLSGSTTFRKLVPGLDGKVGDGAGFPAIVPWSFGFGMENVTLGFGIPTAYDTV
ncbi:hypothetical protein C8F04DRAFT_1090913 [Mycena alexandri]|uniref:Uncharacterized protein n=1 Tax=Mycena alexandri TaxID=1745969 RepID=A0AAD6T1B1_9AGAR|nr:hypothetical protein C8F04DRAFT_1090913 [Mycena alexandri]